MDFFWRDTMVVIPWYIVVIVGCLVLGVLVAVVVGWIRPRP
jgi:hypothetical protein